MTQKHFIEVENGEKVAAVHHEADSDRWVFFCHGFGSNKEGSYEKRCGRIVEEGWNAVRFDFRGNGESDGEFIDQSLSSRIADLKAVVEHFEPEKYVLFGSSFGGKVVFHGSIELKPVAVIGKAPVTYNTIMDKFRAAVENKGEFEYIPDKPIDKRFFDDFDQYSFEQVVENLDIPVAIFHGASDTTVHFKHSLNAAGSLETDVTLQKLKNEKHSFSESAENKLLDSMSDWLERL